MDITLKEVLTTYLSQTILLMGTVLALPSYFIKRYFDSKSKKLEIKHSLFQQQKVTAINRFIESYIESQLFWTQFSHYEVIERKISASNLDQKILPTFNHFLASYYNLMLFLSDKELEKFSEISDSIAEIRKFVGYLLVFRDPETPTITLANEYTEMVRVATEKNTKRLKEIGQTFRVGSGA